MTETPQDPNAAQSSSEGVPPGVDELSGDDDADAIGTAESGTAVNETHTHPGETSGTDAVQSRVEEVENAYDDKE